MTQLVAVGPQLHERGEAGEPAWQLCQVVVCYTQALQTLHTAPRCQLYFAAAFGVHLLHRGNKGSIQHKGADAYISMHTDAVLHTHSHFAAVLGGDLLH